MIIKWLKNQWHSFLRFLNKTNVYRRIEVVMEHPDNIPIHTLVVVMGGDEAKWLMFKCPCGCQNIIELPLMKHRQPNWKIFNDENRLTVYPSIDVKPPGCGSHFWIRQNKVDWV